MKTAAVRTGSLLVGFASLLAIPAVAAGQIDVGQTVGQAVGEVGKAVPQVVPQAAPAPVPAAPAPAPAQPAPSQAPPSAPAAPSAPSGGGGGAAKAAPGGSSGGGSASAGGGSGSRSAAAGRSGGGGGGGATAKAASSGKAKPAGKVTVLAGQTQPNGALDPADGQSFSGAVTTSPDTGVQGDPELPFTGLPALLLAAMGAAALAGGLMLRTAVRRRQAA